NPVISADGLVIAFSSSATNLTSNDTNGRADVFVRDSHNGATQGIVRLSNAGGSNPVISASGQRVVFENNGSLVLYDRVSNIPTSFGSSQTVYGTSTGYRPVISANGNYVAYSKSTPSPFGQNYANSVEIF